MEELIAKWQNLIAGVLIALVLAYGVNNYLYKPKIKEISSLKASLRMIDTELSSIPGGDQMLKDPNAAKALIRSELDELSKKIPTETETPYLINNYISVVGNGLNIDYNLIQPFELVSEQKYKRLPLRVEFEGDYANLNNYLLQLKELPVTIRVDNMDLHKLGGTRKLAVRMMLSAFVMPGGAEKRPGAVTGPSSSYDPFHVKIVAAAKTGSQTEAVQGLRYSGYFIGKQIKAIINDEVLKVGDSIKGYRINRIYKDRVVLEKDKKTYDLDLVKSK